MRRISVGVRPGAIPNEQPDVLITEMHDVRLDIVHLFVQRALGKGLESTLAAAAATLLVVALAWLGAVVVYDVVY